MSLGSSKQNEPCYNTLELNKMDTDCLFGQDCSGMNIAVLGDTDIVNKVLAQALSKDNFFIAGSNAKKKVNGKEYWVSWMNGTSTSSQIRSQLTTVDIKENKMEKFLKSLDVCVFMFSCKQPLLELAKKLDQLNNYRLNYPVLLLQDTSAEGSGSSAKAKILSSKYNVAGIITMENESKDEILKTIASIEKAVATFPKNIKPFSAIEYRSSRSISVQQRSKSIILGSYRTSMPDLHC